MLQHCSSTYMRKVEDKILIFMNQPHAFMHCMECPCAPMHYQSGQFPHASGDMTMCNHASCDMSMCPMHYQSCQFPPCIRWQVHGPCPHIYLPLNHCLQLFQRAWSVDSSVAYLHEPCICCMCIIINDLINIYAYHPNVYDMNYKHIFIPSKCVWHEPAYTNLHHK